MKQTRFRECSEIRSWDGGGAPGEGPNRFQNPPQLPLVLQLTATKLESHQVTVLTGLDGSIKPQSDSKNILQKRHWREQKRRWMSDVSLVYKLRISSCKTWKTSTERCGARLSTFLRRSTITHTAISTAKNFFARSLFNNTIITVIVHIDTFVIDVVAELEIHLNNNRHIRNTGCRSQQQFDMLRFDRRHITNIIYLHFHWYRHYITWTDIQHTLDDQRISYSSRNPGTKANEPAQHALYSGWLGVPGNIRFHSWFRRVPLQTNEPAQNTLYSGWLGIPENAGYLP